MTVKMEECNVTARREPTDQLASLLEAATVRDC